MVDGKAARVLDDEGLSDEVRSRFAPPVAHLASIDPNDPAYERFVREDIVTFGAVPECDIELLERAVEAAGADGSSPCDLLPTFFICFEWIHRLVRDPVERSLRWRRLMRGIEDQLEGISLFHYARSRYMVLAGNRAQALEDASEACALAPDHAGFLNNYAELFIEGAEEVLLSGKGRAAIDCEGLEQLSERFRAIPQERYHPIYYVTLGRIASCLGAFDEASNYFMRAMETECARHAAFHAQMGPDDDGAQEENDFVTEMNEISMARSTSAALSNLEVMERVSRSLKDTTRREAEQLEERVAALSDRLDNEKIDMLEFLGFFAGIISFVIASIQIGAELGFGPRVLAIVVMLGALLIAFGAFSALLTASRPSATEAMRVRKRELGRRVTGVVGLGFALIVAACLLYLVIV